MVAVIFYSPLSLQTRVAHITAEGNITHEVHITRHRRIELAQLLKQVRHALLCLCVESFFLCPDPCFRCEHRSAWESSSDRRNGTAERIQGNTAGVSDHWILTRQVPFGAQFLKANPHFNEPLPFGRGGGVADGEGKTRQCPLSPAPRELSQRASLL